MCFSVTSPACCAPRGTLGVAPGTGSPEKVASGPALSVGGKSELQHALAEVCRLLNSKGARCARETRLPAHHARPPRLGPIPQQRQAPSNQKGASTMLASPRHSQGRRGARAPTAPSQGQWDPSKGQLLLPGAGAILSIWVKEKSRGRHPCSSSPEQMITQRQRNSRYPLTPILKVTLCWEDPLCCIQPVRRLVIAHD